MARFEKGHKKTGGKEKGTPNKTTAELKGIINTIISDQIVQVNVTLDALRESDPDKYLNMLFKLMEFVMPKKRDVTSDDEPLRNPIIPVINYIIPDDPNRKTDI